MREFWATKDEHEREEDEAERLVRSLPKLKPPRKDRRRERMDTERDQDTAGDPDLKGDPDLSMNYKTIGGSDLRSYVRLALAQDRVKVVNKETDTVVMVSPETLKENGSKYEQVEENEAAPGGRKPKDHSPEEIAEIRNTFRELAEKDPNFQMALGRAVSPIDEWADLPNATPLSEFSELRGLTKHFKTIGDLRDLVTEINNHPERFETNEPAESEEGESEKPSSPSAPAEPSPKAPETPKVEAPAPPAEEKPVAPEKAEETPPKAPEQPNVEPPTVPPKVPEQPKTEAPAGETTKAPEQPKLEAPKVEDPKQPPPPVAPKPASPVDSLPEESRKFLDGIVQRYQKEQGEAKKPKTVGDALAGVDPSTLPEPYKSAVLSELEKEKAKAAPKGPDKGKAKPKKKPAEPWPGRREVGPEDVQQAQSLVAKELPAKLAAKFMKMHPDDAKQLVGKFKGYKQLGAFESDDELKSTLGKLKKSFTLDVDSIPPPPTWKTRKGEVPFEKLTSDEQEKALQQHRTSTLAYNIAMRERAIETLAKRGLSRAAAAASVDLSLKKDPEPKSAKDYGAYQDDKRDQVARVAKEHFIASTATREPPMLPKQRLGALEAAKSLGPEAQPIALARVQANDLREVSAKYLGGDGKLPAKSWLKSSLISERDPVSKIISKINAALQDLDTLAKDYPSAVRDTNPDPSRVFRARVLSRLGKVDSRKAAEVEKYFAKHDRVEYDKKKARFERQTKTYERDYADYEKRFDRWLKAKAKSESGETPYRSAPKTAFDEPPPMPPVKPKAPKVPRGYYEVAHEDDVPSLRKSRNEIRDVEERLGLEGEKKKGLVRRVVDKAKSLGKRKSASLYSSYGYRDLTMGAPLPTDFGTREAVYHGVESPKGKPYATWQQAHVCEMGPSDKTAILDAARGWLKSPVLAKSIEGMPKDARFRAALDLAIRDVDGGKYSAAINADSYNDLLSKLSGDHSDPLGTIGRKEASLVAEVRGFAARIASSNPALAYDLLDFAERPTPPAVIVEKQASDDTYAALRSTVIRVASENGSLREQLRPVLRLIKTIDDVRVLRAASRD